MVVYPVAAGKALLPRDVRLRLGTPESNYATGPGYVRSKEVFTSEVGAHFRERFGVDWVLAESGRRRSGAAGEVEIGGRIHRGHCWVRQVQAVACDQG